MTESSDGELTWSYKGLTVHYRPELDGDGRGTSHEFVQYLKNIRPRPGGFRCAFEWCAGPGFIGFALLAEGICDRLVLADISAPAMECVARTVRDNHLEDRVSYYVSDNLDGLPPDSCFDLVVGNPPAFYNISPQHAFGRAFGRDLRTPDPGWALHQRFFGEIARFLKDDGLVCIHALDPFAVKVYMASSEEPFIDPEPVDIRPRPPIQDFQRMMREGGLRFVEVKRSGPIEPSRFRKYSMMPVWLVVSQKRTPHWGEECPFVIGRVLRPIIDSATGDVEIYHCVTESIPSDWNDPRPIVDGKITLTPDRLTILRVLEALSVPEPVKTVLELAKEFEVEPEDLAQLLEPLFVKGWIDYA